MILNGLGFSIGASISRLYFAPQFFATKPVERLLGLGITAQDLKRRLFRPSVGITAR
jgi:hypothetical protein